MPSVLLDQGVPSGLRRFLVDHTVETASERGWSTLTNGVLLSAAEKAGFQVFVTCDKNLVHQQNLAGRQIAIVELGTNLWPIIRANPGPAVEGVDKAIPGTVTVVPYPKAPLRRRPAPEP